MSELVAHNGESNSIMISTKMFWWMIKRFSLIQVVCTLHTTNHYTTTLSLNTTEDEMVIKLNAANTTTILEDYKKLLKFN